jgi:hypothetical protein
MHGPKPDRRRAGVARDRAPSDRVNRLYYWRSPLVSIILTMWRQRSRGEFLVRSTAQVSVTVAQGCRLAKDRSSDGGNTPQNAGDPVRIVGPCCNAKKASSGLGYDDILRYSIRAHDRLAGFSPLAGTPSGSLYSSAHPSTEQQSASSSSRFSVNRLPLGVGAPMCRFLQYREPFRRFPCDDLRAP